MSELQMRSIENESRSEKIKALVIASGVTAGGVMIIILGWLLMWVINTRISPDPVRDAQIAAEQAKIAEQVRLAAMGPVKSMLEVEPVARGKRLYEAACITCHGPEGRGVAAMGGKDLVTSYFAKKRTDKELVDFVIQGRTMDDPRNTTKRVMPPRGGRVDFTDQHIAEVVQYIRYLQDKRRVAGAIPEVKVDLLDAPEPVVASVKPLVSADGKAFDPEQLARGKKVFATCMACHAKTGLGVPMTGADLVHSTFVKSKTDDELLEFVKKGRAPNDPETKMKIQMPPKGGNPVLKDEQLKDVIVYIRSLQQAAAEAK